MTDDPHRFVDVVFDRPPGPVTPRFIEVEPCRCAVIAGRRRLGHEHLEGKLG